MRVTYVAKRLLESPGSASILAVDDYRMHPDKHRLLSKDEADYVARAANVADYLVHELGLADMIIQALTAVLSVEQKTKIAHELQEKGVTQAATFRADERDTVLIAAGVLR